jgi:hypothetical protein
MSFKYLFIAILPLSILACGDGDNSLSPEEKIVVDSLYNAYVAKESKILDSLCTIKKDTIFIHAVDSIKKVRISEIEQLIKH